jgi:hypothetical protein
VSLLVRGDRQLAGFGLANVEYCPEVGLHLVAVPG